MGQGWANSCTKLSERRTSPSRRRDSHGENSSYFLGWQEYDRNPYDPDSNPGGIIQMGLAENQLSFDLLEEWLAANPHASVFKDAAGVSVFRDLALFQDYHGLPAFKQAFSRFMVELRGNKASFRPDRLVLTAGATSANEILVFCLADPGDAFLLPTPYYPGFDRDLKWRTGVDIIPVDCCSANGFRLTRAKLEDAYRTARRKNKKVKGVLITNPSNPLGTTATRGELHDLLGFLDAHQGLHLISDEIYSGTVFDPDEFVSIQEAVNDYYPSSPSSSCLSRRVHIVSSLSKDLGLPGFRIGAIYSEDLAVVTAATKMSSFGLISSQTQHLLAAMLSDEQFTTRYAAENRKRLRLRHAALVSGLRDAGVACLPSNAGLFCWVDMRCLLDENTFQGEMRLWKRILYDVGLNVSPGSSCHCTEPGWFRMCFANASEETLLLAMRRLKDFIGGYRNSQHSNQPVLQRPKSYSKPKQMAVVAATKVWPLLSSTAMSLT